MTKKPEIRVRFAPSPTGFLHIGGLRTALFNWLFAKKHQGKFILRIEDTDRSRLVPESLEDIKESLSWYGLDWDEGPDKGGDYAPYRQSERLNLYQKYADQLIKEKKAYYCFCSPDRLDQMRKDQQRRGVPPKYDKTCLKLSAKEISKKLADKTPHVIRLNVPDQGRMTFRDLVRGKVEFNLLEIDDQILIKSDGFPTYHLAVVVDDNLMKISHVIRGEEWLPSIPKHLLLYKAFGWSLPQFAHLPMILGEDKSKLSKRHGALPALQYRERGYLPETILNFIALLGWNPKTEQEKFTIDQLITNFDLTKVNKAGAVFNQKKLDWLSGQYLRQLDLDKFTELCLPYLAKEGIDISNKEYVKKCVALEQERVKSLSEIAEAVKFFFTEQLDYLPTLLVWKKMNVTQLITSLQLSKEVLQNIDSNSFHFATLEKELQQAIAKQGLDNGSVLWPLRVALSGRQASPSPYEIAEVLDKDRTIMRIDQGLNLLK
ncbi:glutamate--tRNA ligase [Patescibacteria group bacterium]|nr:glutamate--tRNA ligase [Patescibacteria group bacterium]